jgi:hypothetical protein
MESRVWEALQHYAWHIPTVVRASQLSSNPPDFRSRWPSLALGPVPRFLSLPIYSIYYLFLYFYFYLSILSIYSLFSIYSISILHYHYSTIIHLSIYLFYFTILFLWFYYYNLGGGVCRHLSYHNIIYISERCLRTPIVFMSSSSSFCLHLHLHSSSYHIIFIIFIFIFISFHTIIL